MRGYPEASSNENDDSRRLAAPDDRPLKVVTDRAFLSTLEDYVATLKADLAHRDAEIETLKAQLAAAHIRANEEAARTERVIDAFAQLKSRAADEAARTTHAIRVLEQLALRFDEAAKARRPWWR